MEKRKGWVSALHRPQSPMTRRLRPRWETPDPPGVRGTYGGAVEDWAERELGITLGSWQSYVLGKALRYKKGGDLIHRTVLLSTGRQNGKSVIVRAFFGWLLDEGRHIEPFCNWTTLLAAAHDAKQARIIYRGVHDDLIHIPRLSKGQRRTSHETGHVPPIVRVTRQMGIEAPGLFFDTVTSEPGSARGLSAGAIAWDEMLTQRDWDMWEALGPTQSAQRSPIMLLTSTAGHADSVVLRAFYDRLVRQATGDEAPDPTFYGAWWQADDPESGFDLRELRRANPALGDGRLTEQAVRAEYSVLPRDSWKRERLNHFVDTVADSAFAPGVWARCKVADRPLKDVAGPYALGIDIQAGWERATITASAVREDGRVGVEVYRDLRAEDAPFTAETIIEHVKFFPEPVVEIAFDKVSGATAAFERDAAESGRPWHALKPGEVMAACMDVAEMILSARLAVNDPLLDAQIPFTARREIGHEGAFAFGRQASSGPIDAVMATAFAAHAIATTAAQPDIR